MSAGPSCPDRAAGNRGEGIPKLNRTGIGRDTLHIKNDVTRLPTWLQLSLEMTHCYLRPVLEHDHHDVAGPPT